MDKDKIVKSLISGLDIQNPESYHALLMPGNQGPELPMLMRRGVPVSNIWAVEMVSSVYKEIMDKEKSLKLTSFPMELIQAVDDIWSRMTFPMNFVYLDLYGAPTAKLARTLWKIFKLRLLSSSSVLVLTTGRTRTTSFSNLVNKNIIKGHQGRSIGEIYIRAACMFPYRIDDVSTMPYLSGQEKVKKMRYTTVVAKVEPWISDKQNR